VSGEAGGNRIAALADFHGGVSRHMRHRITCSFKTKKEHACD
jgi:hypothetical protein